ncbi:MAG: hypothetical protein L0I62_02225 [Gammaproteobacteria bacterium]|nr:hypothetical protein [Gammaproteobacteria bacterium]
MKPDKRFVSLPKSFWAYVRLIGQECGYTKRGTGQLLVPTRGDVETKMSRLGLPAGSLDAELRGGKIVWHKLAEYFQYRAELGATHIESSLMNAQQAKAEFYKLKKRLKPRCPLPMNKQKGDKKEPAFPTGMVNMLLEAEIKKHGCDYDPRALTTITNNGLPIRTFARRLDGAFPSVVNPIAIWEIKEYYYTTTFGSRVADGVYETLLDGMEIEELSVSENINIFHYLMIDAHYTWWLCGKSYLCRIVDMLHMGYVDEVLIGKEVISRLPALARKWIRKVA